MQIAVVNGSPAGSGSITLQTVEYLKILFPQHEYEVLHVGQQIRHFESDMTEAKEVLERAELILFCYPVYTFLVPAQLHRFLELIKEQKTDLSGKAAAQITTSKHFYDITAHRFIADICGDLRLRYLGGLSADMEDLLTEKGQREAREFFRFLLWKIKHDIPPVPAPDDAADRYVPVLASAAVPSEKKEHVRIALVTDLDPERPDASLEAMIRRFQDRLPAACTVVDLRSFPFRGGCLGCFRCASDGSCVYTDGFDRLLREEINAADAVVYAYTIRDHSMGSRFKMFDDRQFCNGHRTVTMGKPVGYLVSGDLRREENLRVLMEARAEVGGNFLAGVASDAANPDREVGNLVRTLLYALKRGYSQPQNFYGVGGRKIFRDLIWQMQGLMKEDHRFYKEHGFYDFPQKKKGRIAGMYLVSALMNSSLVKKNAKIDMTEGMLMPYRKVLEKAVRRH